MAMDVIKFLLRTIFLWGLTSVFIIMSIAATIRAFFYDLLLAHSQNSTVNIIDTVDTRAILITKLIVIVVSLVIAVAISSWIENNSYRIRDPW